MPDPSPDTPSVCPTCGRTREEGPNAFVGDAYEACTNVDFHPEILERYTPPTAPAAAGSSSPDTAALIAELRAGIAECGYRDADDPCPACASDARCADALEAQAARITELEAAMADHTLTTPTEETTE